MHVKVCSQYMKQSISSNPHDASEEERCEISLIYYQAGAQVVRNNAVALDKLVEETDLHSRHSSQSGASELHMDTEELLYFDQRADQGERWAQNYMGQVYVHCRTYSK